MITDLLAAAANRHPRSAALSDDDGTWTYPELAQQAATTAGRLWTLGVRPADRVVLRMTGGRDFAATLYGALALGAVVVPVNPATGPLHLDWILRDAAPRLMVTDTGVAAGPGAGAAVRWCDADEVRRTPVDTGRPSSGPAPGDIALLMYTSGSTAMPRAVVCPHDRVRFAVEAIAQRLRYRGDDVVFCRLPPAFDYGLYQFFLCAEAGAHLAARARISDAALLYAVGVCGTTVLPLVPTLVHMLHRLATRGARPDTVRLVTSTGAALSDAHAAAVRQTFPRAAVVPMYGMTECKRITIAEPDEDLRSPGTVGRPLTGTSVTVVDADGQPVPPGVVGEIHVRGPHVMAGYWQAPGPTAGRFGGHDGPDRVLRTGDRGYLDEAGLLYFVGRDDDIFKRNGVRMSTQEVEAAVLGVPGVQSAAVVRPGADGVLVAWVTGDVTADAVLSGVAGQVGRARMPDRCVVLPSLPITPNGKLDKAALRRSAAGAPA